MSVSTNEARAAAGPGNGSGHPHGRHPRRHRSGRPRRRPRRRERQRRPRRAAVDPVIAWNRVLLGILNTPGAQPRDDPCDPQPGDPARRDLRRRRLDRADVQPYLVSIRSPRRADPTAAAAAAGYTVLSSLYPGSRRRSAHSSTRRSRRCRTATTSSKASASGRPSRRAARAPRRRRLERCTAGFTPGTQPGDYQPTPPRVRAAGLHPVAVVRPFALRNASQFRPAPPPA